LSNPATCGTPQKKETLRVRPSGCACQGENYDNRSSEKGCAELSFVRKWEKSFDRPVNTSPKRRTRPSCGRVHLNCEIDREKRMGTAVPVLKHWDCKRIGCGSKTATIKKLLEAETRNTDTER